MDLRPNPAKIFYLHIPKTGGQTLATRIASAFRPSNCYVMQRELMSGQDESYLEALAGQKDFIEAHVRGPILAKLTNFDYLVTVRDPLDQMISNYRHIRREPLNFWHRAAHKLPAAQFFDRFGDFFADHQTTYLLEAFGLSSEEVLRKGRARALHSRLFETLDRIRWLVPTTCIDDFIRLWSIETRRLVPNSVETINEATLDGLELGKLREILLARPNLYSFDILLHQLAREHFLEYRKKIYESFAEWTPSDNSRRAYERHGCGVWLTENWHDPEASSERISWWAGPTAHSKVRFRRTAEHKFLCFDVTVVNGIERDQISAFSKNEIRRLDVVVHRLSDDLTTLAVSIESMGSEDEIILTVPGCYAPIMTTEHDDDVRRKSFLSTNWRLAASSELRS